MEVDKLLNFERRTGVKNEEIDDFTRKASAVEAAIKGMLNGTIKPEDVKIEGIETEEEKAAKELKRQEILRVQKEKAEVLRLQRKKEEKERWWEGAALFKPNQESLDKGITNESEETIDEKSKIVNRYKLDYSRWESWTPTDKVSLQEEEEIKKQQEEIKNKEFEKNNPDFVNQFMTDMEERKKSQQKKQEGCDILRLKGNKYFQAKNYERALELYMDALKDSPFDIKTLSNVAQCHTKLKCYEDALEFFSRTLYLDPNHVKALSRSAFIYSQQANHTKAVELIDRALKLEPKNEDILQQKREIEIMHKEYIEEKAYLDATTTASISSSGCNDDSDKNKENTVGNSNDDTAGVTVTNEKKHVADIKTAANTSSLSSNTVDHLIEELKVILTAVTDSNNNYTTLVSKYEAIVNEFKKLPSISTTIKILIRTSNILTQSLTLCNTLLNDYIHNFKNTKDNYNDETNNTSNKVELQLVILLVQFIHYVIDEQRASKLLVLESDRKSVV